MSKRAGLAAALREKLRSMPRSDFLVAVLAADEDLTEAEAAEAIDCTVEEFRSRHARVVADLKAAMPQLLRQ